MKKNRNSASGFTLIELAIAIVIIALLVVSVSAGKSLIAAGKVRAVMKEVEEMQAAIIRFQEKYADLPGDMSDALTHWGSACAGGVALDCNGDGNEEIDWDTSAAVDAHHEGAMALVHLQLAQMLSGETLSGEDPAPELGNNMAGSRVPNAGWVIDYNTVGNFNFLQLGGNDVAPNLNNTEILETKDAFAIDDKLDDGIPNQGRVTAPTEIAKCIDSNRYDLQFTNKACTLRFRLDAIF